MKQHLEEYHPEVSGTLGTPTQVAEVFELKVVRQHYTCLTRQVHEAIRIRLAGPAAINNKEEYNRCTLPCLEVVKGAPVDPLEPQKEQIQAEHEALLQRY